MDWGNLGILVGVPAARGIAGWLENALADKQITKFEWAKLGETVVRIGVIGLAMYFGLNKLGLNVDVLGASAGAVVLDFILAKFKIKKK